VSRDSLYLSGREKTFAEDEIIVSKTDPRGRLVYVNDVFVEVSGYTEAELLGQPHSIIRHPEMPRCVFKLLWDTIQAGEEIFAYVNNRAKNGDNYWVLAHVTPNFDDNGAIVGYHSNRRVPKRSAVAAVVPLYAQLLAAENAAADRKQGQDASFALFTDILSKTGKAYDEFILGL
jgi:PAS domain S-box-containing protein